MLYETAASAAEILEIDAQDNRQAPIRSKDCRNLPPALLQVRYRRLP